MFSYLQVQNITDTFIDGNRPIASKMITKIDSVVEGTAVSPEFPQLF